MKGNKWPAGGKRHGPVLLILVAFCTLFAPFVLQCGFQMDDFWALNHFLHPLWGDLWKQFLTGASVGRNLCILMAACIINLTNGSAKWMHLVALLFDALNVWLAYLLTLEFTSLASLAFPIATIFAFMSNHGPTHFWWMQTVSTLIPTSTTLLAFLIAAKEQTRLGRRLGLSLAIYSIGFFSYEQPFFLWPLLIATAWIKSQSPRRFDKSLLGALIYGVLISAGYVFLRYYGPVFWPGRFDNHGQVAQSITHLPLRLEESVASTVVNTINLDAWKNWDHVLWNLAVLLPATSIACILILAQRRLVEFERRKLDRYFSSSSARWLLLFGISWFFLSYLPLYFWWISYRHNYFPSFGWAVFCVAAVGRCLYRWKIPTKVVEALTIFLFAGAALANAYEGSQWLASHRLHREFERSILEKRESNWDTLFVIGAPRLMARAFGFFADLDVIEDAVRTLHRKDITGDVQITPTLHGSFYRNDIDIDSGTNFHWIPYNLMHVLGYVPGHGFRCVRAIRLMTPDGKLRRELFRHEPDCSIELRMPMDVALIQVREEKASSGGGQNIPGIPGLKMNNVSLTTANNSIRLNLKWLPLSSVTQDLAVVPKVFSQSNEVLFQPMYYPVTLDNSRILFPLYDDEWPATRWPVGKIISETYLLRTLKPVSTGQARIVLDYYGIRPKASNTFLGSSEFIVNIH